MGKLPTDTQGLPNYAATGFLALGGADTVVVSVTATKFFNLKFHLKVLRLDKTLFFVYSS